MLDNIFAMTDPVWHRNLKGTIAPMYSLSNLRKLENLVDECTLQFLDCMRDKAGTVLDFGVWLQWYAFDVIGNITFAQTFNFLRDRADRRKILDSLEVGNVYNTIIGQAPSLHPWLLGNERLMNFVASVFPSVKQADPLVTLNEVPLSFLVRVCNKVILWFRKSNIEGQMIDEAMKAIESERSSQERGTHLEFLHRTNKADPERLSDKEVYTSLTVNL